MTVVINGTTGIDTGTGSLVAADSTTPTYLDLFEDTDNGSNYVRLIAPTSVASNRTQTLADVTGTLAPIVRSTAKVAVTDFTTTADFTDIPSWVKRITVMFAGISLSGTDNILIQIGDSGGLENTGYVSSSTGFSGTAGQTQNNTTGFIVLGTDATYINSGIITIVNMTGNQWVASGAGKLSTGISWVCGGDKTLSATLDRLTVTRSGTNTFDAGTINILYE